MAASRILSIVSSLNDQRRADGTAYARALYEMLTRTR